MSLPSIQSWERLVGALNFYQEMGYIFMSAPWTGRKEDVLSTAPTDREVQLYPTTSNQFLVASGEQSFINMYYQGLLQTLQGQRYCCLTPCFRDEPSTDYLTKDHFMKVELIDFDISALKSMVNTALLFFSNYSIVETINTEEGIDIVTQDQQIELGSYGVRDVSGLQYIYGTGLAEPRLSSALQLIHNRNTNSH